MCISLTPSHSLSLHFSYQDEIAYSRMSKFVSDECVIFRFVSASKPSQYSSLSDQSLESGEYVNWINRSGDVKITCNEVLRKESVWTIWRCSIHGMLNWSNACICLINILLYDSLWNVPKCPVVEIRKKQTVFVILRFERSRFGRLGKATVITIRL